MSFSCIVRLTNSFFLFICMECLGWKHWQDREGLRKDFLDPQDDRRYCSQSSVWTEFEEFQIDRLNSSNGPKDHSFHWTVWMDCCV